MIWKWQQKMNWIWKGICCERKESETWNAWDMKLAHSCLRRVRIKRRICSYTLKEQNIEKWTRSSREFCWFVQEWQEKQLCSSTCSKTIVAVTCETTRENPQAKLSIWSVEWIMSQNRCERKNYKKTKYTKGKDKLDRHKKNLVRMYMGDFLWYYMFSKIFLWRKPQNSCWFQWNRTWLLWNLRYT